MSRVPMSRNAATQTIRAVLTDVQFWVPAAVLALGVALLVWIH